MRKKILITGASGFIGSKLFHALNSQGLQVESFEGNITSFEEVFEFIQSKDYGCIFHLAGISNVRDSESRPDIAFSVNVTGTFNLLDSLRRDGQKPRFVFASTAQVYEALVGERIVLDEANPVKPTSTYALTKLFAENVVKQFHLQYELGDAVILRLFNHTHSTQTGPFFFPELYKQLKDLKDGLISSDISVGNLSVARDFNLVDDLIDLLISIERTVSVPKVEIYNVCSGKGRVLTNLASELANFLKVKPNFILDPSKTRKNDPQVLIGDNSKTKNTFDWSPPERSDSQFIADFLSPGKF